MCEFSHVRPLFHHQQTASKLGGLRRSILVKNTMEKGKYVVNCKDKRIKKKTIFIDI